MASSRLIPLTVAAALFMENMDSSVIATSLPAIAIDLRVDPVALKLAFTAYLIALAVFIPLSAWLTERFGARNVFRVAIAVFTFASFGCGFAWSFESLVAARVLQGVGGAMMIPVGRAVMIRAIPKDQMVSAIQYLTIPALMGPVAGPLIGGFLTTYLDWRWIFWINLPFGFLGITLATAFMPDIRDDEVRRFDFLGFVLMGLGLASLIGGFTMLSGHAFDRRAAAAICLAGAIMVLLYLRRTRNNPEPLVDLRILRIETLRSSLVGGIFFRTAAGAFAFLLPLMLQLGFGLNAFQSGALTFVTALGAILSKFASAPVLRFAGLKWLLVWNSFVSAVFLAVYGLFTASTPHWIILAVLLAGGFIRSLQFTGLAVLAYADIEGRDTAQASTIFSVTQQFSISFGVALAALMLDYGRGSDLLDASHFPLAFFVMGAVTLLSAAVHIRLPANAGAHVSGKGLA